MKAFLKKIITAIIEWEAILILKKYKPRIVAITGSVGKTSTKDAIYTVMSGSFFVRKSEKSFNSEIGVPLTIIGCRNAWNNPILWMRNIIEGFLLIVLKNHYPKWLVLEVGADRPGDIKRISKWLKPDVVVVTALPDVPVHVEFFESPEEVIAEKEYLVKALRPDGVLVLNNDDAKVHAFKQEYRHAAVTFGFDKTADYSASHSSYSAREKRTSFRIDASGSSVPITVHGSLGKQHIYPVLAAFAVGGSVGLDMATMSVAVEKHEPPAGRMRVIDGVKKSIIIDDTYNASPAAVEEALSVLKSLTLSGRKFVALGDMLELGVYSVKEHKRIGELVAESADKLITVGIRARDVGVSALEHGMEQKNIFHFDTSTVAAPKVKAILEKGDVLLVKGSQSMRMERIVKACMANPEEAEKLLVRQEPEWLERN